MKWVHLVGVIAMRLKQLAALALSALLLTAGVGAVAAQSGNAPADAQADEQPDDAERGDEHTDNASAPDEDRAERPDAAANGSENAGDAPAGQGPPTDMPEQVPDHVVRIHEMIDAFLSGDLDGALGPQIADVTPDDGDTDEESEDADVTPDDGNAGEAPEDGSDEESRRHPFESSSHPAVYSVTPWMSYSSFWRSSSRLPAPPSRGSNRR